MKELNKREVILRNPTTGLYDVAHVVKRFKETQYGVHTDDFDFHVSYFDSYKSKAEAEKAKVSKESWAHKMGDYKYFYVTSRDIIIERFFPIDMHKRNSRIQNKIGADGYELNNISRRYGFVTGAIELLAIGLYYPANNILPPLTEGYEERADKILYIYLPKKDKYFLVFNPCTEFADFIEVKDFDLNGGHIRWSNKSLLRPIIYDSKSDWDLIDHYFDFEEAPEF